MNNSRNSTGQYRKSYLAPLLLLMVAVIIGGIIYSKDIPAKTTVYVNKAKPFAEKDMNTLSNETDKAIREAQAKVQRERNQLLAEIEVLQAEQEVKLGRLKELEGLDFTKESKLP